jgi:hypothetical protein
MKSYLFSHPAFCRSPAASGRSAQQSVPSILQPAKDEKHPPPVTPVQVARHSDTDPSIQVTSRRQMSSPPTTTFVDCNCPGCPSQGIRQNSCDSKISDSLQLGGPGYLTTEPAPLHTLSESSVFDWAAPNGVSLPMREMGPRPLVKGALNPDHFSVEGLYSADSIPSNILLQHQSNSIDINQPATIDQCYFPQPGDLLQPRFVSTLLPILSGNTLTDSSMAPAYRTHYLFHESLADTFLTQDLTRNYDLPHNWPHYGADLETFVSSQETGHDLELASAHINHALNDSHCRLTPNKYHNHPTQFATASLEMVRLWPCPCFLRPIREGGIMPARVRGPTNRLTGYHPSCGMVDIAEKLHLAGKWCVVLVLESLSELYEHLGNQYGFEIHILQRN